MRNFLNFFFLSFSRLVELFDVRYMDKNLISIDRMQCYYCSYVITKRQNRSELLCCWNKTNCFKFSTTQTLLAAALYFPPDVYQYCMNIGCGYLEICVIYIVYNDYLCVEWLNTHVHTDTMKRMWNDDDSDRELRSRSR